MNCRVCHSQSKHAHKRRGLGYNFLNEYFEGCEKHHINYNDVIYIPKETHKEIWHSLFQNKNMEQINTLALFFILQQNISLFAIL